MDKGTKDKLVRSPGENGGGQYAQKDLHPKNWKGRDEGGDPEKEGTRKQKEKFKC